MKAVIKRVEGTSFLKTIRVFARGIIDERL